MYIAVYGTLKRGFGNHRLIEHCELVGKGKTAKKYAMYRAGIPYVSQKKQISKIKVEVYDVPDKDVPRVDALEGHPVWYRREEITIVLDNQEEVRAELYFCENFNKDRTELVADGNYV